MTPIAPSTTDSSISMEEIGTGEIEPDDMDNDEIELEGSDLEEIEPEDTDLEEIDAEGIEPETNDKTNTVDRIKHLVDQLLKRSRGEAIGEFSSTESFSPNKSTGFKNGATRRKNSESVHFFRHPFRPSKYHPILSSPLL